MEEKYYLHRVQCDNGTYTKGIEVHDTLDAAVLSFWGRMKTGYNNPQQPGMTFVSCKITDNTGNAIEPYNKTWLKEYGVPNKYLFHHIRKDGDSYDKNVDVLDTLDAAMVAFASAMEYGYNNSKFPNVSFVSCEITDLLSGGLVLMKETWVKPEPGPEPEETPEV